MEAIIALVMLIHSVVHCLALREYRLSFLQLLYTLAPMTTASFSLFQYHSVSMVSKYFSSRDSIYETFLYDKLQIWKLFPPDHIRHFTINQVVTV